MIKAIDGCGMIFHQDKDDFRNDSGWNTINSKCGETFDKEGIDICQICKLALQNRGKEKSK